MNILRSVKEMIDYLTEAAGRMFTVGDDMYPSVGVQPFEAKPSKDRNLKH
ncbi:MAG TPA: isochorismate synthase [Oscillatoriales bacterium UBA8482]|nr:MAG: isochorismate synthase [Oscillatoriales cyanobacterium CG2_30_40_61]HBW57576.1 isochorismate synthase [Oscillatoriales bacterium UBA8482]